MEKLDIDYESAYKIAQENFDELLTTAPQKLLLKEQRLYERLNKAKISPIKKLGRLYEFMEELAVHVNRFTPCKTNCSACCNYPVTISDIEVEYIEMSFGAKPNPLIIKSSDRGFSPCPFLLNGGCTIYESRPFVCRRHVSLCSTNEWCQTELANNYDFPLLNFTEVDKSYDSILVESGSRELVEIRDVFNVKATINV